MYELKQSLTFQTFNESLNPDMTSWKPYDFEVRGNNFGLQEMVFNLSDAIIQGAEDSYEFMDQALSRFQLRFNQTLADIHSFRSC
jgi:hypothetical protein